MSKARELAELSRTVSDSADAVAITIDSSENVTFSNNATFVGDVGIGNSGTFNGTGTRKVQIETAASSVLGPELLIHNAGQGSGALAAITFGGKRSGNEGYTASIHTTNNDGLHFGTAAATDFSALPTTRMIIDTNGNALLGKTTTTFGTAGLRFAPTGAIDATVSGDGSLFLNRLSSDGGMAYFYKDGTTVGVIGTQGGDMQLGTGTIGVRFKDASSAIQPQNINTSAGNDNAVDLGTSSARFKDIYLSGGVNFSANANASGMTSETLNDYEEGSFTPALRAGSGSSLSSVTVSSAVGEYTKVGNLVSVWGTMTRNDTSSHSGHLYITGLPFTQTAVTYLVRQGMGHIWLDQAVGSDQIGMVYITGDTYLLGVVDHDIRGGRYLQIDALTQSRPVYFCASYTTNS